MLPGKTYTPDDLLHVLRRRFWLLLLPFAIVSAATAVVARKLPDRFQSKATIVILPQQVPEAYVKSSTTAKIGDRLPTITQRILTRAKLESIIEELDLYAKERRAGMMQDVVDKMRDKDIDIRVVPKGDAFTVSYEGAAPGTTKKVAEKLASLFKDQNLLDREVLAEGTSNFLETQLAEARRRLQEHDQKLQKYREEHSGSLPSQLQANLTALTNTWQNIQSTVNEMSHNKDRRLLLQRQLLDLTDVPAPVESPAPAPVNAPADPSGAVSIPSGSPAAQLANAKSALAMLQQRGLTDKHPDVVKVKSMIAGYQVLVDAEALQKPVSAASGAARVTVSPAETARQGKIDNVTAEMELIDKQLVAMQEEEKRLRVIYASLQAKIDSVPARESEMTDLMRDYNTLQTVYTNLLARREEANISKNLERLEIGEQFNIVDPPRVPDKPSSPNRPLINLIGMAGGIGVGLLFVGLLEYRDSSFKTDSDLTRLLSLPVLAVVPLMRSETEKRRLLVRQWVLGAGMASVVAVCAAVVLYTFVY